MGNMTCRNVDTTNAHSCASGVQSGATMTYDNAGQLESWQAPTGTDETDQYLYDGSGQRVLKRTTATANGVTNTTDTITFNGYTDTTVTDGVTMDTTKYYSVGGQNVAMVNSQGWFTLVPDMQGGSTLVLNANGSVRAVQLFAPYGAVRYSSGTMPTDHNYTGQKLDSASGLLYYNARYYDPVSGRFISADTVENNGQGNDPYAYVKGNPETATDPSGHRMVSSGDDSFANSVDGTLTIHQMGGEVDVLSSSTDYSVSTCTMYCGGNPYWGYASEGGSNGGSLGVSGGGNSGGGSSATSSGSDNQSAPPQKKHTISPYGGGVKDWGSFAEGAGEVGSGSALLFGSLSTSEGWGAAAIFIARGAVKYAFSGISWLITDGLRRMNGAFAQPNPLFRFITDLAAIVLDVVTVVLQATDIVNTIKTFMEETNYGPILTQQSKILRAYPRLK
jgi:RHS repeat-associated core domain